MKHTRVSVVLQEKSTSHSKELLAPRLMVELDRVSLGWAALSCHLLKAAKEIQHG